MVIVISNYVLYLRFKSAGTFDYLHFSSFLPCVIATVESKVPHHLLSELEMIIVGWFKEFEERDINAFYKDAILHISNEQDDNEDMVDDIIHEIAHAVEEAYGFDIRTCY